MNFFSSIKSCYSKYIDFKGLASRTEYWYFALFTSLTFFLAYLSFYIDGKFSPSQFLLVLKVLVCALYLSTLIPTLSVTSRRLHDIGFSGWLQLIVIVPFGGLLLLAMLCKTHKDSKYINNFSSYTFINSKRKRYLALTAVTLISIFASAGIFKISGVYDDYQIAIEISKLSPYERSVLGYQLKINSGEISKSDMKLTQVKSLSETDLLISNAGKQSAPNLTKDLLESNEQWWVEENQLFIVIGNYQAQPIASVVFSLQKGNCETTSGEIIYLNFDFGGQPLLGNSKRAYTANLPFNYPDKFGPDLNCGLIIGAKYQ